MIAVCIIVGLLIIAWLTMGYVFYTMTLPRRLGDPYRKDVRLGYPDNEGARNLAAWADSLTPKPQSIKIQSHDGLSLSGLAFVHPNAGNRWVITVHGYTCGKEFMLYAVKEFYDPGMNVLTIDLRGHGESDGRFISMGWADRLDVIDWVHWIEGQYPGCEIALYGVSMGAATVTMAICENLPSSVKSAVADCGYTSAVKVFAHHARIRFSLPEWVAIPPFAFVSYLLTGQSAYAASPLKMLNKVKSSHPTLPLLLFHGEADNFVPYSMAQPLFEAAGDRARLITTTGADHGECAGKTPGYWDTVRRFMFDSMGAK